MTTPSPDWFKATEVSRAPASPGLYAWYAVPAAGRADWAIAHDAQGNDIGAQRLARFLASHTRRLRHPPVKVQMAWHLWARWAANAAENSSDRLAELVESAGLQPFLAKDVGRLNWTLTNAPAREALANILFAASPRLSAPIYIGVAAELRDRLGQHTGDLTAAAVILKQGLPLPPSLSGKFGARAASSGLRMADLWVGILAVPSLAIGLTPIEQRRVIESAEFILNRWHHPILGRR